MRIIQQTVIWLVGFAGLIMGAAWIAITFGSPNAPQNAGQAHHWTGAWPTTTHARDDGEGQWTIFCSRIARACTERADRICPNGHTETVMETQFVQAIVEEPFVVFGRSLRLSFKGPPRTNVVDYRTAITLDCTATQASP
jgi:hypothetical protein